MDCPVCGEEDADFYRGVPSKCKDCHKKAVRENRRKKLEYYREYDRRRSDRPDRVAARAAYAQRMKSDPDALKRRDERIASWQERNLIKRRAHVVCGNAIRDGRLAKAPCARCGAAYDVRAHHEDYTRPLDVTWLCPKCHGLRHREINRSIRRNPREWARRGFIPTAPEPEKEAA